jgi:hypothetical protein
MGILSRIFGSRAARPDEGGSAPEGRGEAVTFDDEGVKRTLADGRTESVTWDELQEVLIVTTDQGPFAEDVFWVLSGNGRGCAIASEAQGMKELLPRLLELPGFDNTAVIRAMGSAENARFLCWKRQ